MEYNKYVDLKNIEDEIFEKTITENPEIGWFKEFYEDFQKIINIIPFERRKKELPENPAVYYLNITSTLKIIYTSVSILHLISKGYYGQSMNLLRAIQEEYHHMLFFNYHPPNEIKQWNEGKIKSSKIQSKMSTSKHIPKKWKGLAKDRNRLYEALSLFEHPSRVGWSSVVKVDEETGENILKLLPLYESNSFNTVFIGLMSYIENTLLLLLEIYEEETKAARLHDIIKQRLIHFETEYLIPTLNNMKLDIGTKIIG